MSEDKSTEDVRLKRITIKTESGTRWFASVEDFVAWIQQQTSLFSFLRQKLQNNHGEHNLQQRLQQQWTQLQQIAQQQVKQAEADPERYVQEVDSLTSQFQQKLESKQIFTSEAPFADFVIQQTNAGDYLCAAATIAYFMDENLANFDFALARGLQKVLDWERGQYGKAESETQSLFNLRESWDEELSRQTAQADQSQERLEILTDRAKRLLDGQRDRFDKSVQKYDVELKRELDKARQDLESLTQTYDDKLALQAPVRYWGLQEKYHRKKVQIFAAITGFATVTALAGLVAFAWTVLDQKVSDLIVGRLVTMAVLTTFAVWAVRLCANLFMSHNHLHTDAQERRTMIHTYLSLLRKKNALNEDERQLILQTLFRPNATGMIKDDAGPANLVDLINRMSSRGQ